MCVKMFIQEKKLIWRKSSQIINDDDSFLLFILFIKTFFYKKAWSMKDIQFNFKLSFLPCYSYDFRHSFY
jgi:hypothetical protein